MDYDKQIAAVTRSVRGNAEQRSVTIAQILDQEIQTVWEHITKPELVATWFSPVTGDLHQGGRYQIQGNASGTIEACNALEHFRLSWEMGDDVSWVDVRLSANNTGDATTRIELTHEQQLNDHWRKYGAGAGGVGWDMSLAGLVMRLSGVQIPAPDVWFAADSTKNFLKKCSLEWETAAIEGGEDAEAAKKAAAETTAFYVPG